MPTGEGAVTVRTVSDTSELSLPAADVTVTLWRPADSAGEGRRQRADALDVHAHLVARLQRRRDPGPPPRRALHTRGAYEAPPRRLRSR